MDRLVWIGRVRELARIEETETSLEIGAGVTYAAAAERLAALYPDFGELLRRLGSVQVRNMGTIGGNVANGSPIGDSLARADRARRDAAPAARRRNALAADRAVLPRLRRARTASRASSWNASSVPKPQPGTRFRAYKVSKRFDQDISAVLGAFLLRCEDGVIAEVRLAYRRHGRHPEARRSRRSGAAGPSLERSQRCEPPRRR